jgi:hypothetical protein
MRTSKPPAKVRNTNAPPRAIDEDLLYTRRFSALGARDLLDARDAYHVHLAHKANVIATAIGLYLIRRTDDDFADYAMTPRAAKRRGKYGERTLENSVVRPWSWPCILVFVSQWQKQADLAAHPEHIVPPFVYLEDGRIVPVCVVKANHAKVGASPIPASSLETDHLCGGSPIFAKAQGQVRAGSVGCIVTDGTDYFALTNRHVAGEPGRPILASFRGLGRRVGNSADRGAVGTRSFSDIYSTLPGRDTRVNLDVGLVRIANVSDWRTSINGLGEVDRILDFCGDTASLDWIGRKVAAHGAASGQLRGEIRALFYRYASVGGREYVTDFLIAPPGREPHEATDGEPRPAQPITRPGDSGTLWCVDGRGSGGTLRPLALEWGGQKLAADADGVTVTQFALASSIAVICRELELDVVTSWTAERPQYWGAVGHFKIAQQACFHVQDGTLRQFLQDNLNNLSFSDDATLTGATHLRADAFVPLSDVPDIVWKTNVNRVDKAVTRPAENPNHYADMDLPGADGRTLFDICGDPARLDPDAWRSFYASAEPPADATPGRNGAAPTLQKGCLPFRVWQIFSALQGFAAAGDVKSFLCAAGVIAHYVGDACQPLHSSQHSDGLNGASTGVHSTYEDHMVERHADDIATGVDQVMASGDLGAIRVSDGQSAGVAVVELMRRAHANLAPETICASYNRVHSGHKSPTTRPEVLDALWADCGEGTIRCIADGIRVLAAIWDAAFEAAKDKSLFAGAQDQAELRDVYSDKAFLPSKHLDELTEDDIPGARPPRGAARASRRPTGRGANGKRNGRTARTVHHGA